MRGSALRRRLRAAGLAGVLLLGSAGVTACNDARAPMLQPVAPVPEVTEGG